MSSTGASACSACHSPQTMIRLSRVAAAYVLLGLVACCAALFWRGVLPFVHPDPWLPLPFGERELWSLGIGLAVGGLVVLATRWGTPRWNWMKRLHAELRPVARGLTPRSAFIVALLSSVGEELLFRGVLQLWLGLWAQALIFGLLHYLPGPSRWSWPVFASVVGLGLGAMFQLTGSLVGPIAAHCLINAINLLYLKSHNPEPSRSSLGGLLGQRG